MRDKTELVTGVLEGKRLALARLLTLIEIDDPEGIRALDQLYPHTGRAHLVGITGAPGSGKSSLVNQIALLMRQAAGAKSDRSVAIVAVDPTSPFTGGAVLGDRVRMRDLSGDPGIFIRSMASRGALGGLARTTAGIVQVLDAAGFDMVLIETVGAGQAEIDVARLAHTTVVVEAPGMGDDIQAIKAGILEIADILVINKADRPGLESTIRALRSIIELGHPSHTQLAQEKSHSLWIPPVLQTVATRGKGIGELLKAIDDHGQYLRETGLWQVRERSRLEVELAHHVQAELSEQWHAALPDGFYQQTLEELTARKISPHQAARKLTRAKSS